MGTPVGGGGVGGLVGCSRSVLWGLLLWKLLLSLCSFVEVVSGSVR